jgi:hypothetical protein
MKMFKQERKLTELANFVGSQALQEMGQLMHYEKDH